MFHSLWCLGARRKGMVITMKGSKRSKGFKDSRCSHFQSGTVSPTQPEEASQIHDEGNRHMNVSIEKKREEAIKRMQMLGIFRETIRQFKDEERYPSACGKNPFRDVFRFPVRGFPLQRPLPCIARSCIVSTGVWVRTNLCPTVVVSIRSPCREKRKRGS